MTKRNVLIATLFCSLISLPASAGTVGYWRMEDGATGTEATTLDSTVNNGVLQGTEAGAMFFSSDVAGPFIQDGVGGGTVANASSLKTLRDGNNRFSVDDPAVSNPLHEPGSFTYEMFLKADASNDLQYQVITLKSRGANQQSWGLTSFNSNNTLLLRVDSNSTGDDTADGFNHTLQSTVGLNDGEWHHVAITYDGTSELFSLYYDYTFKGTLDPDVKTGPNATGAIVYDGGPLLIGGRTNGSGWNGWIDEVRLSDTVLTTDQFLRATAVPEPSSLILALVGGLGLLGARRRRR